jgi:uncharacterized protein
MNKFILGLLISLFAFTSYAQEYPANSGYVTDLAGIIESQDEATITNWTKELEDKTGAQVVVATIDSTSPDTIENYAVKLFEKWGIGQKTKDNGVLLLVAARDRALRIEVGYGLEGALTDALSNRIINTVIVPQFKAGQLSGGIVKGASSIVSVVAKEYNVTIVGTPRVSMPSNGDDNPWVLVVFILIFIMMMFFSSGRRGGGWTSGGGFGGGFRSGGGFSGGGGMSGGGGSSGKW